MSDQKSLHCQKCLTEGSDFFLERNIRSKKIKILCTDHISSSPWYPDLLEPYECTTMTKKNMKRDKKNTGSKKEGQPNFFFSTTPCNYTTFSTKNKGINIILSKNVHIQRDSPLSIIRTHTQSFYNILQRS